MSNKGPYNIEITNEECIFLNYALNLMDHALHSSISPNTNTDDISRQDASEELGLLMGVRDKTIEDAAGRNRNRALELLESLRTKITYKMNT